MNKEKLNQVATACFGSIWQKELSNALQVNPRTVRRWASGETPVPSSIKEELALLIKRKHAELNKALDTLTFYLPHSLTFKSENFGEVEFFANKKDAYCHALKNHQQGLLLYYGVLEVYQGEDCRMMYACQFMPELANKEFAHEKFISPVRWTKNFEPTEAGVFEM